MQDHIGGFLWRGGNWSGSSTCWRRKTRARLGKIDRAQADEERNCSDSFKIQKRLDPHASNLLQVGVSGDAYHQRGKNQRSNDGLDQTQKDGTQDLQVSSQTRPVMTNLGAQQHAYYDP